jgi:hypothetical protein
MRHPSNRELLNYWNERRGARLTPDRADLEPSAISTVLGDTFLLDFNADENVSFRLAGTRLCALFRRELKGENFFRLWQRSCQTAIHDLIVEVMEEKVGCVAGITAATSDDILAPVQLEMVLLPLASHSQDEARAIGALAPLVAPYWLGAKAISPLTLGTIRYLGAAVSEAAPRFKSAAGRIKQRLTVYDGGLAATNRNHGAASVGPSVSVRRSSAVKTGQG